MGSSTKPKDLPAKYRPGFLDELDKRSEVYRELREFYDDVIADAGGKQNLSRTKATLVERFVFLTALIQTWESRIALAPNDSDTLVSKWLQAINTLQGLAQKISLDRIDDRKVPDLKAYLESKA